MKKEKEEMKREKQEKLKKQDSFSVLRVLESMASDFNESGRQQSPIEKKEIALPQIQNESGLRKNKNRSVDFAIKI